MQDEFIFPVRVYIEDTDAGGIVYYANYLKFMERARTEYLRHLGFPKAALLGNEVSIVVVNADISYKKPAKLDELINISVQPQSVKRGAIVIVQQARKDGELLCEARVKLACLNRLNGRPTRFPQEIYNVLSELG